MGTICHISIFSFIVKCSECQRQKRMADLHLLHVPYCKCSVQSTDIISVFIGFSFFSIWTSCYQDLFFGFLYFVFPNKIQYFCSFLGRNPFRNQKRITKQKCSAFFHLETIKIAIYPLDLWTCCRNLIFWPVPPYLPEELEEVWASLLRLQAEWLSDRKG